MKYSRILLLFLAATAFYLLFAAKLPVTDPVESNYALTAREMLASGDWLSPRIYGHYWYDKPIMIYWLLMGSYKLLGISDFAARVPSAVFSGLSVALVYWFTAKLYFGRTAAFWSAVAFGTTLGVWAVAKLIITDAALVFFTSAALAMLYLAIQSNGRQWYIPAYACAGLAVLTKGPVGVVLPGLIMIIYIVVMRRWELVRRLATPAGLGIFLIVVLPWYGYMYGQHGQEFINTFFGLHNYIRATVSEHPKDNVFYYYLVLFPISLLPWAGVCGRGLLAAARGAYSSAGRFLATWLTVIIVFYSLMATKYPTYVLPAVFPAAIIVGCCLERMGKSVDRRNWLWLSGPAILFLLAVAAGALMVSDEVASLLPVALVAGVGILLLGWLQIKGPGRRLPGLVTGITIVVLTTLSGTILPRYFAGRSAKPIAAYIPADSIVAVYGDYSTSAVYYSGQPVIKLTDSGEKFDTVWSGKHTMPYEEAGEFFQRTAGYPNIYLIINDAQAEFAGEAVAGEFLPVAEHAKLKLTRRIY